jgi:hypothetical protein
VILEFFFEAWRIITGIPVPPRLLDGKDVGSESWEMASRDSKESLLHSTRMVLLTTCQRQVHGGSF